MDMADVLVGFVGDAVRCGGRSLSPEVRPSRYIHSEHGGHGRRVMRLSRGQN